MKKFVYHGSQVQVAVPEIRRTKYTKDFGYGFYCTNILEQAKKWCLKRSDIGYISIYEYNIDASLLVKQFVEDDEWLDFVVACRTGINHSYDIVEGAMADDKIFNFVDSFVDGDIPREVFWALMKFNRPTHQISFHTPSALKALKYISSERIFV